VKAETGLKSISEIPVLASARQIILPVLIILIVYMLPVNANNTASMLEVRHRHLSHVKRYTISSISIIVIKFITTIKII
jgi:hypothetical protein